MNKKNKVVILGGGFISTNLINYLKRLNLKFLLLNRKILDLSNANESAKLKKYISKKDIIVFIAAKAPVKNFSMFEENIKILNNVCMNLKNIEFKKIIYISSDAIYSDIIKKRINENSVKDPSSLHGLMHLYRENILKIYFKNITILRPTLIFGSNDPHNGYGPNSFIRNAQKGKNIKLFGKGEEIRDHVHIDDVVKIITIVIKKNFYTDFNIVSSKEVSFYEIAKCIQKEYKNIKVLFSKEKD